MPVHLRNRVVERRKVRGRDLLENPANWRQHPKAQREALAAVLAEIGQAGELLAYHSTRNGGQLTLIDGHLRAKEFGEAEWDVAITDLTDEEADKLLAVHDPLAAMATTNKKALARLLGDQDWKQKGTAGLLDALQASTREAEVRLRPVDVQRPPKMTWVLLGIPTVRFGEIAEQIERLAAIEGIVCESTVGDGDQDG